MSQRLTLFFFIILSAMLCSCGASNDSQQQAKGPHALSAEEQARFQEAYSQGLVCRMANDTVGAYYMFERASRINPLSAAANYQLGCVMKEMAFVYLECDTALVEKADSLFYLATQQAPYNYEYLSTWTDCELEKDNYEEALVLLEKLTTMKKNNEERLATLASVALSTNHFDIARKALDRLGPLVDDPQIIISGRFLSYIIEQDTANAMKIMEDYADTHADKAEELAWVGSQYADAGLKSEADRYWKRAEALDPNLPELQMARFKALSVENDKAAFQDIIRRIILNPRIDDITRARVVRICRLYMLYDADTEEVRQDKKWAKSVLEEAYNGPTCDASIMRAYAETLEEEGADFKTIEPVWSRFLEDYELDNSIRLRLILGYREAKDWKSYFAQCHKGQEVTPDELIFYYLEGVQLYYQGDSPSAAKVLQRGIGTITDLTPTDLSSDACATLGDILHELGRDEEAFASYESALKYNADNALCMNNYAYFLSLAESNLERAEELSKRTVDLEPHNTTYLDTYSWVLFVAGKHQQAKIYIEQAIKYMDMSTPDATVFDHAGDIYSALGEREAARSQWTTALKYSSDDALTKKLRKKLK